MEKEQEIQGGQEQRERGGCLVYLGDPLDFIRIFVGLHSIRMKSKNINRPETCNILPLSD